MNELGVYFELIAAKAKILAVQCQRARPWASDVREACSEIREALNKIEHSNRQYEPGDR